MSARVSSSLPRGVLLHALLGTFTVIGLAAWWVLAPGRNPLPAPEDPVSLLRVLDPRTSAVLCLVFGLLGAAVAVGHARQTAATSPACPGTAPRGVLTAGWAAAAFFVVVAADIQLLIVLGYAMALLGGPAAVVLLLAGARRHRANLPVLGVFAAVVALGVVAGEIGSPTVTMLENVRDGFVRVGIRPLVVALLADVGLVLGTLTLRASTSGPRPSHASSRLDDWGRRATVVAALAPLPYGLLRLTWATPWPRGLGPGGEEALDGGIRAFGLCLGLAALAGAWVTLGLNARWGEVWPAWLPGLRGRRVPVPAVVLPASIVGTGLCAASVSLAVMAARDGGLGLLLVIPAPVWGPALLLATYAYYRRRIDSVTDVVTKGISGTADAPNPRGLAGPVSTPPRGAGT